MRRSKVMAALVTLGLAASAATPAMALENQFYGTFTTYYDVSNYNAAGELKNDSPTANYFEQRIRLGYTAKANEELKLVTTLEFDYSNWGNSSYDNPGGRGQGGALGADTVNVELKTAYLNWNIPAAKLNAKIGMQPYGDAFKGIFVSADMAGILLTHECAQATTSAGFFRWDDTGTAALGKDTRDMFVLDGKYNVSKDTKLGAAYYLVNTNNFVTTALLPAPEPVITEDMTVHMLGVNAETRIGAVSVDGFLAYQFGTDNIAKKDRSAFAGNVGANMKLSKGTARTELLYVSGDKNNSNGNSFYTPASKKFTQINYTESGFYNNEMVILSRDKNAMTNDNAIVGNVNNRNQGVIFGSVGYDYPFTDKISGSANAGFAAVAKDNSGVHESNYLGTEVNAELNYKYADNLNLSARAGYVVLGDYFKGTAFDNPYDAKLIVKYTF